MDTYLVAIWSDGTWCYIDEVDFYLTFMSDDYKIRNLTEEEIETILD
jgi:hypothetical protein